MIQLGPFEIEECVGTGAMGQVWRGHHQRSRTPVAVKFVVADGANAELAAASVRREAVAIAGLQHPNVVYVYDQGVIDEEVAEQLSGVPAGSPWIVMELLSGGTLHERHVNSSWERLREDLERILGALAHCHARGVLHRDLKPTNVLFGAPSDPRPGLKLVDFGIAWSGGRGQDAQFGTPEYCAPEQLGNEGHAQGPWSDIYAVGAIGWALATGSAPWDRLRGVPLFMAKAAAQFHPFEPRFEVPDAWTGWLQTAMAGPPGDRFQSAPDALYALRQIGGKTRPAVPKKVRPGKESAVTRAMVGGAGLAARSRGAPDPAPLVRELIDVPIPPPALRDAGLGLWRFRPAQYTGRMPQRVRLWQRLEHTVRDRRVGLVSLRGPPGSGRTRTARWLVEAALINGGVHGLMVSAGKPGQALRDLLVSVLRGEPSDPEGSVNAHWMLQHHGITYRVVVNAVEQWFEAPGSDEKLHRAVVEVVRGLARGRPLVLVLDDADQDPAMVRVAIELAQGPAAPLLVVGTCASALEEPFVEVPTLDPLRKREMSQLLASVLPLSLGSAANLVAGAGGLPGRGLGLVRDVFDRGDFCFGPAGLELDLEPDPPSVLPDVSSPVRSILERAALLGVFPDATVLTRSFGNQRRARLALQRTEQAGLLTVTGEVISFSQGVRKAALLADGGTGRRHHKALGRALPPESPEGALHRVRGGDVVGGFQQLVGALRALEQGSELYRMLDYCERGLALWQEHDEPVEGPWVFLVLERIEVLAGLRSDDVEAVLEHDLALALAHNIWNAVAGLLVERAAFGRQGASRDLHFALEIAETDALRGRALHGLSRQAERTKDVALARYWLKLAARMVASSDREAAGHARIARARLATMEGAYGRAAAEVAGAIRNRAVPGELDLLLAGIQLAMGEIVPARSSLLRAVHWMTLRRDRRWLPTALVRLGLVELLEGCLDQCEARLAEADRIRAENRSRFGADPTLGAPVRLVLCLERGEWFRAMEALGYCPDLAWCRPTHVAVMNRVRELLDVKEDMPEPVREAVALAVANFDRLQRSWLTR